MFSIRTASAIIGVVEVTSALRPAPRAVAPRLGVVGGLLATGTFVVTLSFLASTPGLLAPGSDGAGFILKDVVLLGAALHVAGTSALAARSRDAAPTAFPAAPALTRPLGNRSNNL